MDPRGWIDEAVGKTLATATYTPLARFPQMAFKSVRVEELASGTETSFWVNALVLGASNAPANTLGGGSRVMWHGEGPTGARR